jgi:hypothetical protein
MKRSPLTRRTPMPRTVKPLARKPMKRSKPSYPSAKELSERTAWGQRFDVCWVCGAEHNLQVHEIASRAQAPLRWADKRNYFRACGECNGDFLNWCPEAVQLALKSLHDSKHYDREFVNELRHRATEAIPERTVNWWRKLL